MTTAIEVTDRTGRRWQASSGDDPAEWRRPGRPGHAEETWDAVREEVRAVLARLGFGVGERTVHRELGGKRTLYQVRTVLHGLKAEHEAGDERARLAQRRHVQVHARGVIWSLDGTELGRDGWGTAVIAEQVRDVGSTKTLGVSIGPPPTSEEVVMLVQRVVETTGETPLVLAADGGPENLGELIAWCREHGVILLRNLPYTPEHNAWVEHGNGELKRETGLASDTIVLDLRELPTLLLKALDRIDGLIPRATRGWRTAREAWREMPCAERLVELLHGLDRGLADVLGELIDEAVNEGADLGLAVLRHGGSERGGQPGWEADRSIGKSGGDSQARSLSPHYHAVVPGCP